VAVVDDLFADLSADLRTPARDTRRDKAAPDNGSRPGQLAVPVGLSVVTSGWGLDDLVENPVVGFAADPGDPIAHAVDHFNVGNVVERADPKDSLYLRDPVAWARDRLGVELWSRQRGIIESVRDHPRTAVHTCHTIGKSFGSAVCVLWWNDVHPPGTAFVVTTAPTASQVRAILWREIGRLHTKGGLQGRVNLTSEWYIGSELVAMGRKPPDYKRDAFQGIHARYVLVVFDEACGIPRSLWDAASTLVSNEESRFLAIGNPDDANTAFGEVCGASPLGHAHHEYADTGDGAVTVSTDVTDPGSWNVIHVGASATPNFTGEPVSEHVAASLISRRWAEDRRAVWGERSAIYQAKVEGVFPTDADNGTVPFSWAVACTTLDLPEDTPVCAGLDVAGDGADRTVLRERRGPRAGRQRVWADEGDTVALATQVATQLREWGVTRVVVDATGVGHGMVSELKRISTRHQPTVRDRSTLLHDAEVVAFKSSEKPSSDEYLNARAELYWNFRELCRLRLVDLAEVDVDVLGELCAATYEVLPTNGKIKIEPKSELSQRLGASPDRAEALLMAYWERHKAASLPVPARVLTETRYDRPRTPGHQLVGPIYRPVEPTEAEKQAAQEEYELASALLRNRGRFN
jgi:hypothetical protein